MNNFICIYLILGLMIISYTTNCASTTTTETAEKEQPKLPPDASKTITIDEKTKVEPFIIEPIDNTIPSNLVKITSLNDWNRINEGFINSSTFQVKVTSLKTEKIAAYKEAQDVAKRKAYKMLLAESIPYLSPESKVEIKIITEEFGKIVAESDLMEDKHHFVFHIKKPALEIIIKEKLK